MKPGIRRLMEDLRGARVLWCTRETPREMH